VLPLRDVNGGFRALTGVFTNGMLTCGATFGSGRTAPGVADLHDLHAWRISEGFDVVTVHVVLDGALHGTDVARDVARAVRDRHGITHVTVQPEAPLQASVSVPLQVQRPARR